jgi:hypothetical protein
VGHRAMKIAAGVKDLEAVIVDAHNKVHVSPG